MKTVFAATQIHNYSNKSYFQKFRLNIINPGNSREVIQFPGFKFSLKSSGIPGPGIGSPTRGIIGKKNLKMISLMKKDVNVPLQFFY